MFEICCRSAKRHVGGEANRDTWRASIKRLQLRSLSGLVISELDIQRDAVEHFSCQIFSLGPPRNLYSIRRALD
ncbi:MAG: hypothetical protein DMG19_18660 [Acidobacteria bacterium]|nr:MAG: hypothetical protein DMG19_18660 [Acidobacteriota bacterium]